MMNYMLAKLETQMLLAVDLQKDGNLPLALSSYELMFEVLNFYEALGYRQESDNIRSLALACQQTPEMVLYCHAQILFHRRKYQSAADTLETALLLSPDNPLMLLLQARAQIALDNYSEAHAMDSMLQKFDPASGGARDAYFMLKAELEMPGEDYYTWLQNFHKWLKPASYVEIGLGYGRSLALAGPGTKVVGIDPYQGTWEKLNYVCPHGPATLFPLTSDAFFEQYDLRKVIGYETFDLGFIDGLHLFEQALKDFINLERYSRRDSVILIHDCLPIAPVVAERERSTGFWTGDVWRIIPCLKTFRPDLKIMTIPTKPSGLGVVTNLDHASTILTENYDDIVRYYLTLSCPESFDRRCLVCNTGPADEGYVKEQFCGNPD